MGIISTHVIDNILCHSSSSLTQQMATELPLYHPTEGYNLSQKQSCNDSSFSNEPEKSLSSPQTSQTQKLEDKVRKLQDCVDSA